MRYFVWVFAVAACGDNGEPGPVIRFALPDTGVPKPLAVPFPSDVYRDTDGTIVEGLNDWTLVGISDPEPSALLAGYGALEGFGLQSGVLFGVDGIASDADVDVTTLPMHAVLVDVDDNTLVPVTAGWDHFAHTIAVLPDDILLAGHRYAAGLVAGITLATGEHLAATAEFGALRDGTASGSYGDAIAALVAAGVDRSQLLAATLYTTATDHRHAVDTAARLFAGSYGAAPAFATTGLATPYIATRFGATAHVGWTATLDEWLGVPRRDQGGVDLPGFSSSPEPSSTGIGHDAIAAVLIGTIVSPWFPRPFTMTAAYDDGTTANDSDGHAVPADANAQVPAMIVLPRGPVPVAGFPVAIFQHGLGGQREDALAIANELARNGIATVAIDGPLHGMRNAKAMDTKSNGKGTYTGPDGLADSSDPLLLLDVVGDLRNGGRARDVVWQFSFDLISLRRMIDVAALDAAADEFGGIAPTLDHQHVALIGWSLGGLASVEFSALAPNVDPCIYVSPASNIARAFSDSPVYAAMSTLIAAAANVPSSALDAGHDAAIVQLIEGLDGPADTGAFAPLAAQQHALWLMTAVDDESVPHAGIDQLARALGVVQLAPNVRAADRVPQAPSPLVPAAGKLAGWLEVSPGNHSHAFYRYATLGYEPPYPRDGDTRFVSLPRAITIRQTVVGEQRAMIAFIRSAWSGTPTIAVAPGLSVADFDDDGYCDDDERAAGTDPYDPASVPSGAPGCTRDVGF